MLRIAQELADRPLRSKRWRNDQVISHRQSLLDRKIGSLFIDDLKPPRPDAEQTDRALWCVLAVE